MTSPTRREMLAAAAGTAVTLFATPRTVLAAEGAAKGFTLPPLAYEFDALEPFIDAKTMEIHHDRHHKAYVDNLNKAVAGSEWASMPILEVVKSVDKAPAAVKTAVRNNGGGHFNHSLFWQVMGPKKGGQPEGDLAKAIDTAFGSFSDFKAKLTDAAVKQFGSGWGWLIVKGGTLAVSSTPNQDNPLMPFAEVKGIPILGVDVWEHAYYLKYQNARPKYVEAWFSTINWDEVAKRFAKAKA
jgi:Fe-Mn family superoxide dismutase